MDEQSAEEHARLAQEWHDAWYKETKACQDMARRRELFAQVNPYDVHPPTSMGVDYGTAFLFVHSDPKKFHEEHAVLLDVAREKGWIP